MTRSTQAIIGILSGAVLVAVLVLGAIMGLSLTQPAQAQNTGVTGMRQVTVIGDGEVRGKPDTAHVQIGVETNAATTQEALDQNNAQVAAIIAKLTELGISEDDIQTTNFNIYAAYDNEGRQVTGYNVSNTVAVTIRDLEQTGTLLDQVIREGANRIYGISFSVDDPSTLLEQARGEAMDNARAKAEQLAQGSRASLGQVLVITENIGSPPPIMPQAGRANIAEDKANVPIQAGEQTFQVQVQVTFELR
ncbi:MAG: SIMPL domain-containing protein [Chloroflexales bacterium]|nr:SIMPL domain-containing protein [Chloroflexales bacterium]